MSTIPPPTPEAIHAWGWEMGVEAGRRLADESDAFIGMTMPGLDAPAALEIYGRAYLRALIQGYRTALRQSLRDRADTAADQHRRTTTATPKLTQKGKKP
ncbi:hypothetical protein [Candidatus Chloroploca asiatica]|uniref:Uncharacterized protein n=1 Tax=Candidatus Chloroploca asiatica TaxID=1506545 RepID=A0A2H3L841_9CHLR|nr:hypothetical protein [Candidatus Chloroploca asiatica]PDW01454.1 hypothetical protein A9Q02_22785 [Candidatus Chloroploca asiatica]